MKKTFLLVVSFLIFNCLYSQNNDNKYVINSGFEQWINEDTDEIEPVHWHTIISGTGAHAGSVKGQVVKSTIVRPGSSGKYSVMLRPKSILGIIANGNLTNGRINAGSTRASNHEKNYDYTQRDNSDFCTPINIVPDSIVAWVCFRAKDEDAKANFVAVVHGDCDFIYSGPEHSRPQEQICAMAGPYHMPRNAVAKSDDYVWKRVSIPFALKNNDIAPKYILILFSTNYLAGEGSAKDELFIDDVELIFNK